MLGLWSNQRRTKVNLNSSNATSASNTPIPTPPIGEATTDAAVTDATEVEASSSTQAALASNAVDVDANTGPDVRTSAVSGKRKVRSTRTGEESSKRAKLSAGATSRDHAPPNTRLSDLGGVDVCVEKMLELVAMPLCHPEVYLHTGVQPPRGVLLHGPPGCGKTLLANAMAGVSCIASSFLYLASLIHSGTGSSIYQYIRPFYCIWDVRRI
jgi:ribosome biogenesis ATPase